MKTLHEIINAQLEAWAWAIPIGGNGHPIGGGIAHAYLLRRQPLRYPINGPDSHMRVYYQPWTTNGLLHNRETVLFPACGPIRSRSRFPHLSMRLWDEPQPCPDCRRLHPETARLFTIAERDPWNQIPRTERHITPDPVTGA